MSFNEECYNLVKKIPRGKITTYKEICIFLNSKNYRGVGRAMRLNQNHSLIPCHRVIKSDGNVGGYNKGQEFKIKLLESEGHKIKNLKVINYKNKLFKFNFISK